MVEIIPTRTLIRERHDLHRARNDGSPFADGRLNFMAEVNGWIMCRRPACIPFVMPLSEWNAMPFFHTEKS